MITKKKMSVKQKNRPPNKVIHVHARKTHMHNTCTHSRGRIDCHGYLI